MNNHQRNRRFPLETCYSSATSIFMEITQMEEMETAKESAVELAKMLRFIRNHLNPWAVAMYFGYTTSVEKERVSLFGNPLPPFQWITEPVVFELGRIHVSKMALEQVTLEEIGYCLDGHRRCYSHDMVGDRLETLAFCDFTMTTHFCFPRGDWPREQKEVGVVVVTGRSRTRTVVRLDGEALRERRNRLNKTVELPGNPSPLRITLSPTIE